MFKKHFTPQEAQKRLPLVKDIVADILSRGKKLQGLAILHQGQALPAEATKWQDEIEILLLELENLGCFYKGWNFEIGLVDFPAIIDGHEVMLCWRSDESALAWYHGLEDGYAGRKPIPNQNLC